MLKDQISGEDKAIGTLLGRDFEFDAGAMLGNFSLRCSRFTAVEREEKLGRCFDSLDC